MLVLLSRQTPDQPARNEQPAREAHPSRLASNKQIYYIKALAKGVGFDEPALHDYIAATLDSDAVTVEVLTGEQATAIIAKLKALTTDND